MIFNKQSTAVTGPHDPIHVPRASHMVDWEGELAVVIGKPCRHVPRDRAASVISTGTPSGVGAAMDPQVWLEAGDTVRIEIEDIGQISNPVIDEPAETVRF